MGQRLRHQEIADVLIPLISRKWQALPDSDKRLLPLFECFEQVIHALGGVFMEPHITQIYERCTRILHAILQSVRTDAGDAAVRDSWSQGEALFMRTVELISVILLTMGPEKSTQLI